jgi:hypothetical protein
MAFDDDPEEIRKAFENPRTLSPKYAKHLDERRLADLAETNPDRKRAPGGWAVDATGRDILCALDVRRDGARMGAIVLRATGDPKTGRLTFCGMSIFSNAELEHGDE